MRIVCNPLAKYVNRPTKQKAHHLRYSSSGLMGFLHIPPVACGQGVLEPIRNDAGLNGQLKIKVLAPVNKLLCIDPDLLQQVLEHSGKNRHVYFNFGCDVILKHAEVLSY